MAKVYCIEKRFRLGRGVISYLEFENKIEPSSRRKLVSMHQEASSALKMKSEFETKVNALEGLDSHIYSLGLKWIKPV